MKNKLIDIVVIVGSWVINPLLGAVVTLLIGLYILKEME